MKKTVIITIAGISSRFSKSTGKDIHKAIYSDDNTNWTTLSHQLNLVKDDFQEIIIVTGHQHEKIKKYLESNFSNLPYKIIFNDHYIDYGSCYSLILGINAVSDDSRELLFLEGDLIFDTTTYKKIVESTDNVITSNNQLINSKTSVVFYVNEKKQLNYIYDTNHNLLQIKEPFLIIGNSGQVWKFINVDRLKKNLKNYGLHEYCGTNLVPINDYYKVTKFEDIKIIEFKHWYNCNTIDDFKKMKKYILQGE